MTRTLMCLIGSIFLVGHAFAREPGPDYEQLKAMQWMIGDWEGSWQVQSGAMLSEAYPVGAKVRTTNAYSWMQNKNYIRLKFRDEIGGKTVHEGLEMIGRDPKTKKTIHWLFSVIGGSGTGEWQKERDAWVLTWSYTAGDGTMLEGVSYLNVIDEDTHTWQMKKMKENGKDIPDTPLIRFHRVNRKGQSTAKADAPKK
ncbi:hypothetical protein NZK35_09800 [Stieleria sp. ICT_E10.1]|uniref:hypothetical protein n=1 Tax=Stieleria sedimenti TaxID=2976331 RepID=UPI00217FDA7C|nr:hypothetical protein [Stieleria sedimenti]MCS7466938.1 hypothetical protein [Stieleria sedimenti]